MCLGALVQKTTPQRILDISKFEYIVIIAFSTYIRMPNYLILKKKKLNNKFYGIL